MTWRGHYFMRYINQTVTLYTLNLRQCCMPIKLEEKKPLEENKEKKLTDHWNHNTNSPWLLCLSISTLKAVTLQSGSLIYFWSQQKRNWNEQTSLWTEQRLFFSKKNCFAAKRSLLTNYKVSLTCLVLCWDSVDKLLYV